MPITRTTTAPVGTGIPISLTDFLDFVTRSGAAKQTKVKQLKERDDYHPAFDYYRVMRDAIVDMHQSGSPKSALDAVCASITDVAKKLHYEAIAAGYKKWWGRKVLSSFVPPFCHWHTGDVDIRLNPELGLIFGGQRHIVKLYFKEEPLTKAKADEILSLLEHELRPHALPDDAFCLLDVRKSRLYINPVGDVHLMPLLMGEVGSLEVIWKSL